jgi:hypothetical protein
MGAALARGLGERANAEQVLGVELRDLTQTEAEEIHSGAVVQHGNRWLA